MVDENRAVYNAYLASEVWKLKRSARLRIDGHQCQGCLGKYALHVHHRTYKRFGGLERMSDLVTLCNKCHMSVHEAHKRVGGSLDAITAKFLSRKSAGRPVKPEPEEEEIDPELLRPMALMGYHPEEDPFLKTLELIAPYGYTLERMPGDGPVKYALIGDGLPADDQIGLTDTQIRKIFHKPPKSDGKSSRKHALLKGFFGSGEYRRSRLLALDLNEYRTFSSSALLLLHLPDTLLAEPALASHHLSLLFLLQLRYLEVAQILDQRLPCFLRQHGDQRFRQLPGGDAPYPVGCRERQPVRDAPVRVRFGGAHATLFISFL